jgi:hypothetical protein
MAVELEPYSLDQMQNLVRHSVGIMDERHQRWRILETLYRTGDMNTAISRDAGRLQDLFPELDKHVVNLILPHINIIMASVVSREPQFIVTPIAGGQDAEKGAEVATAIVNYFWRRLRITRELRDASADAIRLGSGFVKVGWTHLEQEAEKDELSFMEEVGDEYERRRLDAMLRGEEFDDNIEYLKSSVPHSYMQVIKSEPFVSYVSPYDVFVPQNARRMDDLSWVVQRVTLPVDEILSNPEFDIEESDLIRDGNGENIADEYQSEWRRQAETGKGQYQNADALDTATYWEFYDMRTRKLTIFQLEANEPLWEGELPWSHRYPPFVHIRNFTATGNDFWGFGDIENVANIQSLFNEFLTEQIENARRSGQKYLVRKDAMTDELMAALESPESDVVAPVDVPNGEPLSEVIVPVFRQALAGDVYGAKVELENYMRDVMGINDFQAGGMGADRMSATAAAVVEGVATLRAQDKITSIEDAASQIGNVMVLLCQEYLDEPTAIRISGDENAIWTEVSKSDIFGEHAVAVEGGSLRALNPATREQQGLRLLNEVVPLLVQFGYDPEPAIRNALRALGYRPDEMLIMAPQPQGELGMESGMPELTGPTAGIEQAGGPPTAQQAQFEGGLGL